MKAKLIIFWVLISPILMAQTSDPFIDTLIQKQQENKYLECQVLVEVDVRGIDIPDKQIYVKIEEGGKLKIKSKGLLVFPKKGLFGQMDELFQKDFQAIFMGENQDSLKYKFVSLDEQSDWITADIVFTKADYYIYKMKVNTRENGEFNIQHKYQSNGIPESSSISFNVSNSKLPLKFLGRKSKEKDFDSSEISEGRVTLIYTDFKWLKSPKK